MFVDWILLLEVVAGDWRCVWNVYQIMNLGVVALPVEISRLVEGEDGYFSLFALLVETLECGIPYDG